MGTVNTKVSKKFDFGGYATKYDIKCSDGRTIRKGAFKHCDGLTVPLVWMHGHDDPALVLGHALLESREDGVYAYGKFNNNVQVYSCSCHRCFLACSCRKQWPRSRCRYHLS